MTDIASPVRSNPGSTRLSTGFTVGNEAGGAGSWSPEDEAGYAGVYLRCYPVVLRTVTMILRTRAAAEDVTQDAFVQLYVHWRKVSRYESPEGWVHRVAIRLATKTARRDRLREMLSVGSRSSSDPDHSAELDLHRALGQLTPQQRAVVALYYFDDLPVAEAAQRTGWSVPAVKVALHRARRTLAGLLQVEGDVDE
jgi:RNA polymerase sigma factor (sigma-70 family)